MSIPIHYFPNVKLIVRKGKTAHRVVSWVVTKYATAYEVMTYDSKTMTRLRGELLKNSKATDTKVVIESLGEGKVIGNGINDLKNGNKPS